MRQKICKKDGKEHRNFSVVENRRMAGGRVVQRHVLYPTGRDQRQPEAGLASLDRGLRRRRRAAASADTVPRRPLRQNFAGQHDRPPEAIATAAVPATAVGCVLVGPDAVAGVATRPVLGRPAPRPQGHALGPSAAGAGGISACGARQRVAVAPGVV